MTTERTPYDGKPYYCTRCGAGLAEYVACEDGDCELEKPPAAIERQHHHVTAADIESATFSTTCTECFEDHWASVEFFPGRGLFYFCPEAGLVPYHEG